MATSSARSSSTGGDASTIVDLTGTRFPYRQQHGQGSRQDPFTEVGTTGLKQYGGFVLEEWLSQLQGKRAAWVWREMADNSAVVGAFLFAIEMLARKVDWRVECEQDIVIPRAKMTGSEFVQSCMDDMSHPWGDFISEALSFLQYGWALHEEVFKLRQGEQPTPPALGPGQEPGSETEEPDEPASSKYEDGLIGWRKLPIRAQETLLRWDFDGYAGLRGMEQVDWHGGDHLIPIAKSLLFRTKTTRGNPEGRSILRSAYQAYYYMQNIQTDEAIGISRDLTGIPVARAPEGVDIFAPQHKELFEAVKRLVTGIEKDEQQGVVLPERWELELLSVSGSRMVDTDIVLRRYRQEIAASVLADFMLVGLDGLGSYSMVDVKSELFGLAVDAILDIICEVFNRYAIPRLFKLNGFQVPELPRINHSSSGRIDLVKVGEFLRDLALSGAPIPWSNELIEQLFGEAGLPANFEGETTEEVHKAELLTKAAERSGVMVALYPSPDVAAALAHDGGEDPDELHITLAYLGKAAGIGDTEKLKSAVAGFAASTAPLTGEVSGLGRFTAGPEPCTYASVDSPALPTARQRLVDLLDRAGFPPSQLHGFTPHITLAYDESGLTPPASVEHHQLRFGTVVLQVGSEQTVYPLTGVQKAEPEREREGEAPPHESITEARAETLPVKGGTAIVIAPQLAARAGLLAAQLERELLGALKRLGIAAAIAYQGVLGQGPKDPGSVAERTIAAIDLETWVTRELDPLLDNQAARVAGDTARTLSGQAGLPVKGDQLLPHIHPGEGLKLSPDLTPQVKTAIQRAIEEGHLAGAHPTKVAQQIEQMVPAGRFVNAGSKYRAQLIARDQTANMQRQATLAAYQQMPSVTAIRVRDGIYGPPRSDATCMARDGNIVPIEDAASIEPYHPACSLGFEPVVSEVPASLEPVLAGA